MPAPMNTSPAATGATERGLEKPWNSGNLNYMNDSALQQYHLGRSGDPALREPGDELRAGVDADLVEHTGEVFLDRRRRRLQRRGDVAVAIAEEDELDDLLRGVEDVVGVAPDGSGRRILAEQVRELSQIGLVEVDGDLEVSPPP